MVGDLYKGVTDFSGAVRIPSGQSGNGYNRQNQSQMSMTGTSQTPSYENSVTHFDYYGALPNKSSNYVARTADFSSF